APRSRGEADSRAPPPARPPLRAPARPRPKREGPPLVYLRPGEQLFDCRRAERVEDHHSCAREQRRVELKARILGRGPNESDRAVFHDREETVLLGAVEAMDFIDKQQGSLASHASALCRLK